jgi:hypothetical protein
MADCIYPRMNPMEAPAAYPLVDCPLAPTAIDQLPASHNTVLPPGKLGKLSVVIARP